MEFITKLTGMEFPPAVVAFGIFLGLLLLALLFFRPTRAVDYPTSTIVSAPVSKPSDPIPQMTYIKDSFDDEISTATLILGGGKEQIELINLESFKWDSDVSDIILEQDSNRIFICLGEHDLFITKGTPRRCDFSNSYPLRIWARGELIFEGRLAELDYESRHVTGYDQTGADINILLGPGLSMFSE